MLMRIAGIMPESIVDGQGIRFVVFLQGCPHHCPGCHNPETHDFFGGKQVELESTIQKMEEYPYIDGITLSGGEPLLQVEACLALAKHAKKRGLSVWLYTGFTFEELQNSDDPKLYELLHYVDIMVDGKFDISKRSLDLLFCGSSNQRVLNMQKSLAAGKAIEQEFEQW